MNRQKSIGALCAAILACETAAAQVVDIRPRVVEQRIVTDGFADATSQTILDERLFVYNFGEYPSDPYFSSEPGINAPSGSGLPAESALAFNVLDGSLFSWSTNLVFWDGQDADPITEETDVEFGPPLGGEALSLQLSSNSVTVGEELGELPGFTIQTVSASGSVHRHLSSFLEAGAAEEPAEGLYLFAIKLVSDGGLGDSLPAFLLYANGVGSEARSAASSWVEQTLISPLLGDANLDGRVDLNDFGILKNHFGSGTLRSEGDFNADSQVNLTDFGILKENFGRSAAAAVPEPATLGQLALGLALASLATFAAPFGLTRRRRTI
jgi:hypothetical protein